MIMNNAGKESVHTVKVKNVTFGNKDKVIISGPCAVESFDSMLALASELKNIGVNMLRGGVFKPRTSPYDFQGIGYDGLKIMRQIGDIVDLPVSTEIMDPRDVEISLEFIDAIQIGSRNMYNYSLLKEVGKTNIPVILKRGMTATYREWLMAAEYISCEGNSNIILCERGIRTFETETRNTLDLNAVPYIKNHSSYPIIVDPSHGTGLREMVVPMSLAAIACGADGLIIESAINPEEAISDKRQTISTKELQKIISSIKYFKNQ